ncbi:MAG: Mevalonate kinase [Candidatus Bathyarchaeota archaeon BA1]|nr:MAG: Mevalonate kinase [Candidatus Bathyarchaeota archaeon BA1]
MGVFASAPAKTILFGEHFVVYGEPAVVLAIDKRAQASAKLRMDQRIYISSIDLEFSGFFEGESFQAERGGQEARIKLEPIKTAIQRVLGLSKRKVGVSVEIRSSIPVAAGLGSSAAVATAVTFAVGQLLDMRLSHQEVFRIAYEAERLVHGTPSGIDPAISTYGGVLLFSKDRGFTPLDIKVDIPLVIGDTRIERSTGEMVAMVREKRERQPLIIDPIIKIGGEIALQAVEALKSGDLNTLGDLMNINHALLYAIGVSNETLERLIYAARGAGALGAKITGAGGGGCMIALAYPEKLGQVANAIEQAGGTAFIVRKTSDGVRVEQ